MPKSEVKNPFLAEVQDWPTTPGVYLMRDEGGKILYIGKAKNLRNRIRSYFQKDGSHSRKTRTLVKKIAQLEYTVTNNELEALLLECNLIKKHRPRYNIRLKDDKNFPYFVLDFTHAFPQFRITRKVKQSAKLCYFGPFSGSVRDISRFLLKTFQIRDCSDAKFRNRKRPCLNYEIGTCTAPCVDYVSEEDYAKQVNEAALFLRGKRKQLLTDLKKEMQAHSNQQEYELAKVVRDKIYALKKVTQKQDAVLTASQQDIDVIGIHQGEDEIQWLVLFIRNGGLSGRKSYRTKLGAQSMEEAVSTFLGQFYSTSLIPDEVWLMEDFQDRVATEALLTEIAKKKVRIKVRRSEQSIRLLGMAYENAKLIYEESQKKKQGDAAVELQRALGLADPPVTIEGMDVSNLRDESPVVSLVHFEDGAPRKTNYRLYHPKTVEGQNDFAMLHEAVSRRYAKGKHALPDLLMIDGGKGQLSSAVAALEAVGVTVPICSLAKSKTLRAFTSKSVDKTEERIFVPNRKNPILLKEGSSGLRLLQQVRDEAHRFAIQSHRRRREKKALTQSALTELPGFGKKTRERLLQHFSDVKSVFEASDEALKEAGLNKRQIAILRAAAR